MLRFVAVSERLRFFLGMGVFVFVALVGFEQKTARTIFGAQLPSTAPRNHLFLARVSFSEILCLATTRFRDHNDSPLASVGLSVKKCVQCTSELLTALSLPPSSRVNDAKSLTSLMTALGASNGPN